MIEDRVYITPKAGVKVQVKGPFNLNKIYKTAKDYFDSKRYDMTEKKYEQKDKPHGKEIDIVLENEREISNFMKYNINFTIIARKVFPKDDIFEGEIDIRILGFLDLDTNKIWKPWKYSNFLLKIYNNYIIKKEIEKNKDKLYSEVIELQDKIRNIVKVK